MIKFILPILFLCISCVDRPDTSPIQSKPESPLKLSISEKQRQTARDDLVLDISIRLAANFSNVDASVSITLPSDVLLKEGQLDWAGKLTSNEEKIIRIVCRVPANSRGIIEAKAVADVDGYTRLAASAGYQIGSRNVRSLSPVSNGATRQGRPVIEYPLN